MTQPAMFVARLHPLSHNHPSMHLGDYTSTYLSFQDLVVRVEA